MKEIVYLDTEIMNSMLAQLEEGLINSFSMEESAQSSETNGSQSQRGKNAGVRGQLRLDTGLFPGGGLSVGGSLGNSGSEITSENTTILEGQKDILNKAFHDHALEILTQKLNDNEILNVGNSYKEGELYLEESTYKFYDFDLIRRAADFELIQKILTNHSEMSIEEAKRIVKKRNPTAQEREKLEEAKEVVDGHQGELIKTFKQLNSFGVFAAKLLTDLTVVRTSDKVGLLKKKYMRESVESLSFRTDTNRKIKILLRVIGKKDIVFDGTNMNLGDADIDKIPNMMLDLLFDSFNIINQDDVVFTPIAIYYESN